MAYKRDVQVQARNITVYTERNEDGSTTDVGAKAFYPNGKEVTYSDDTPPQHFEVGAFWNGKK